MTTRTAPPQPHQTRRDTLRRLRHALRKTEDQQAVAKLTHAFHEADRPGFRRVAMSARLMKLRMSLEDLHRAPEPKTARPKPVAVAPEPVPEPVPAPEPAPKKVHKSKFAELNLGDAAMLLAMNAADDAPPRTVTPDPVQDPTGDDDAAVAVLDFEDGIATHVDDAVFDPIPQATEAPLTAAQPDHLPDPTVGDADLVLPGAPEAPVTQAEPRGQTHGGTGSAHMPAPDATGAARGAVPQTGGAAPKAVAPKREVPDATLRTAPAAGHPTPAPSPREPASAIQRNDTDVHPAPAPAPKPRQMDPEPRAAAAASGLRIVAPLDGVAPNVAADRAGSDTTTADQATPQDEPVLDVPEPVATAPQAPDTAQPAGQPDPVTITVAPAASSRPVATDAAISLRAVEARPVRSDPYLRGQTLADGAQAANRPADAVTGPHARQAAGAPVPGTDPAPVAATAETPAQIPAQTPANDLETKVFRKPKKGTAMVNLDAMTALAAFTAASPTGLGSSADDADDDWLWKD